MATAQRLSIDESHCVLCCDNIEFSACGECDHPICLKCCVKLRLLRREFDCPVCRAQLKEVIVSKGYKSWADKISKPRRPAQHSRNFGIFHENPESQAKVDKLLEHRCSECDEIFKSFQQVKDHLRKTHCLFFCDICLRHLKLFTRERKCYTREALVKHRKEGDSDDRSHRGHPLCQFCDERYLDNDELLSHLRKNHFWCYICEKDGSQDYYPQYKELRRHFKEAHFLCEEGECVNEKFTSVFRAKIDFQAHIAQKHAERLSKAEARQVRQLDINITFNPRESSDSTGVSGRDYSFSELGYERYRERSRMTSNTMDRSLPSAELRDPGRYKGKEKERDRESRRPDNLKRNVNTEQKKSTDINPRAKDTEDHKRVTRSSDGHRVVDRGYTRSPRDVLREDHKQPPGNQKKILNNSSREPRNNSEKKCGKSKELDDMKGRKDNNNKMQDLSKQSSGSKRKKNGTSVVKVEEINNEAEKKTEQSKPKNTSKNKQEKSSDIVQPALNKEKSIEGSCLADNQRNNVNPTTRSEGKDVNLTASVQEEASVSNAIQSTPNLIKDFPELPTDKKAKATVSIPKQGRTYESEFPTLSAEAAKPNPSVRPPPGFASVGLAAEVIKNKEQPKQQNLSNSKGQLPDQVGVFFEATTKSKQAQKEVNNLENAMVKKITAANSKAPTQVRKPTYESEFPTLSSGHRAPPGLAPPGFQPGKTVSPPPGMGWTVPLSKTPVNDTRNQKLINDIRRILNFRGESFDKFREVSGCYRQGNITAERYYQECVELLGEDTIHKVFKELIDLLPDEEKQRQLLLVYNDAKVKAKDESVVFDTHESSEKFLKEGGEKAVNKATNNDMSITQSVLDDDGDFPALSKASVNKSKSAGKAAGAWARGK